jgi:hypothetical protein
VGSHSRSTGFETREDHLDAPIELELHELIVESQVSIATEDRITVPNAVPMLVRWLVMKLVTVHFDDEPIIDEQVHETDSVY